MSTRLQKVMVTCGIALLLGLAVSDYVHAVEFEIGGGLSVPSDSELDPSSLFAQAQISYRNWLVYGSYDNPEFHKSGQEMGELEIIGYGLGYRFRVRGDTWITIAAGKYDADTSFSEGRKNEIVHFEMLNSFGEPHFNPSNYVYKLDGDYGGLIQLTHRISEHLLIVAQYRFAKFDETFQMWDRYKNGGPHELRQGVEDCSCWWIKKDTLSINAGQIGLLWRF